MPSEDKIPRLSRLTAILLKLQSSPFVTVRELSEQFGVSLRTIYRDLAALEQSGVPLAAIEGKGFSLVEGYKIPPVMFTETEANALIIAEKFIAKTKDASLISEFGKAIDKIKSVLPKEDRLKSHFLSQRTIIGKNWENERTSAFLSDIQKALTNLTLLQITYLKKEDTEATERIVEPFAIYLNTSEHWILIAWCRLRSDFRTFRIDRIQKLQLLKERFEPHEWSLEEYVEMQRVRHANRSVT